MAPKTTITKLDAARAMLDRSLAMLLDEGDYISAIVLAGSAEDVLQGLIEARGSPGARAQLIDPIRRLQRHLHPGAPEADPRSIHSFIREVFNWMRHADKATEAQSITIDLCAEATMCALRAMDNFWTLTQTNHPRERELFAFDRATQPQAPPAHK